MLCEPLWPSQKQEAYQRSRSSLTLTQPAVTLQMRRLETAIGGALLNKGGSGTSFTELGRLALAPARRAIEAFDQLLALNSQGTGDQIIRLGVSALLLPKLLRSDFTSKYPNIFLISDHSREIRRGLLEGLIDVGCGFASDSGLARLDNWVLERHPVHLSWVRSKDFKLQPGVKLPVVGLPDDNFMISPMRRQGIDFRLVLQTADLHAKFEAVRAGMGMCVAPTALIPADLTIARESYLPDLEKLDACICCRPEFDGSRLNGLVASLGAILTKIPSDIDEAVTRVEQMPVP